MEFEAKYKECSGEFAAWVRDRSGRESKRIRTWSGRTRPRGKAGGCMHACGRLGGGSAAFSREADKDIPIMIIGRSNHEQLSLAAEIGLQPCVFTPDDILFLQRICKKSGKTIDIHLKFDTGMCRIGIRSNSELEECIKTLSACPNVHLAGVFTHFANSDARNKADTCLQHQKFLHYIEI